MTEISDIFIERTTRVNISVGNTWTKSERTTLAVAETEKDITKGPMNILVIGGSGFIGTALVAEAIKANHRVTVVSRGNLPIPPGATHLKADRNTPGELESALCHTSTGFDLVVDCIANDEDDIAQDINLFACCGRLVVLSSDVVFDPLKRTFPQEESCEGFVTGKSPIAALRKAELALFEASHYYSNWTILRPCHVYGPGRLCGVGIPPFKTDADIKRLIEEGTPLDLPGGGHFLIQPLFVGDLARLILACPHSAKTAGKAFSCAGPDIVEISGFFQAIAAAMDTKININETLLVSQLAAMPATAPYFCHRIYSMKSLKQADLPLPNTTLSDGIAVSL